MIAVLAAVVMHWLVLNDIHLTPYDLRHEAPYGEDTNPWLYERAVDEMRAAVPDARVIVLGGDLLAHHFPARARDEHQNPYVAGRDAIRTMAQRIDRAFPSAQVLLALGNNDDPCGDYHSETGGAYISDLAGIFEPLVNRHHAAPAFKSEFTHGGYYTAMLPGGRRAVVLNSVLWSFVYRGSCQTHSAGAGNTEMAWASSTLSSGDNVVIMHMPLGYDPESTTIAHRILSVPFLADRYDAQLRKTFEMDRSHIAFAVAGHTHRYDFRIAGGVPMLVASSLSPVYRNSPAFYELDVVDGRLHDVVPFTYDIESGSWVKQPSFDTMYGTSAFTVDQLQRVHERIVNDPSVRRAWIEAYDVWSWRVGDVSDHRWQTFACAQVAFGAEYARCAGTQKRSIAVVAAFVAAIAVAGVLVVMILRRRMTRR